MQQTKTAPYVIHAYFSSKYEVVLTSDLMYKMLLETKTKKQTEALQKEQAHRAEAAKKNEDLINEAKEQHHEMRVSKTFSLKKTMNNTNESQT
jgi:hypothetical protein